MNNGVLLILLLVCCCCTLSSLAFVLVNKHNPSNSIAHSIAMASMSSNDQTIYTICPKCRGEGRLRRRPPRKARNRHDPKRARHSSDPEEEKERPPTQAAAATFKPCMACNGSGLIKRVPGNDTPNAAMPRHQRPPSVAIVGGGIGGLALALACQHRSIPCNIYERDRSFVRATD